MTTLREEPRTPPETPQAGTRPLNELPDVFLNTDVRALVRKVYSPEELRDHNPFNGVGGLENLRMLNDPSGPPGQNPDEGEEQTQEPFATRVKKMMAKGADTDAISMEVQRALAGGVPLKEVMDAVQKAYNDPSLRSKG